MGFRNIVLPDGDSANVLERDSSIPVPQAGYFKTFEAGAGSKTMKMDERGWWMGASDFEDAPFQVDMEGNISITATEATSDTAIRFYDSDGNLVILLGFEEV